MNCTYHRTSAGRCNQPATYMVQCTVWEHVWRVVRAPHQEPPSEGVTVWKDMPEFCETCADAVAELRNSRMVTLA